MKKLNSEDWAVLGAILFIGTVVLCFFGVRRFELCYIGVGAWILSILCFVVALVSRHKNE